MPFPSSWGSSTVSSLTKSITQTAHGFTVGQWVYLVGAVYTLVDSDAAASTDSVWVVSAVTDANIFVITFSGYVTGMSGLTLGRNYVSNTAGAITSTAPTVNSKAVFIADTATSGYVQQAGAIGVNVVQYGETVITPLTSTTGSASFVDVPGSSFTLPSAGTWEVFYYLPVFTSASNRAEAQIYTSADVLVADTGSVVNGTTGTGNVNIPLINTARIITTAATTYKLKWAISGGTMSMSSSPTGDFAPKITWKQIGASPVPMDLMGESGENNGITNGDTFTTTLDDIAGSSFTLPTAGTYDISWALYGDNSGTAGTTVALYNSSNVIVSNSGAQASNDTADLDMLLVGFARVITTGSAIYKLRGETTSGTFTVRNTFASGSPNGGNSKITWRKISGFIPGSAFAGATSLVAGNMGFVPTPAIGDNAKLLAGDGTWASALVGVRRLVSGTSYVPTAGTNKIVWYVIGWGGGGGAVASSINTLSGGGGGAGGVEGFMEDVSDQTTYTYSIGTGGASSTNGTSSTITVNGNAYTAGGGTAGTNGTSAAPSITEWGAGWTATNNANAFMSTPGWPGMPAFSVASNNHVAGAGGSNMFGSGGKSDGLNASGSVLGSDGEGYGGGGSGAVQNNSTARAGGAGTNGAIIIFEYR
jgi:hypothetical protein